MSSNEWTNENCKLLLEFFKIMKNIDFISLPYDAMNKKTLSTIILYHSTHLRHFSLQNVTRKIEMSFWNDFVSVFFAPFIDSCFKLCEIKLIGNWNRLERWSWSDNGMRLKVAIHKSLQGILLQIVLCVFMYKYNHILL